MRISSSPASSSLLMPSQALAKPTGNSFLAIFASASEEQASGTGTMETGADPHAGGSGDESNSDQQYDTALAARFLNGGAGGYGSGQHVVAKNNSTQRATNAKEQSAGTSSGSRVATQGARRTEMSDEVKGSSPSTVRVFDASSQAVVQNPAKVSSFRDVLENFSAPQFSLDERAGIGATAQLDLIAHGGSSAQPASSAVTALAVNENPAETAADLHTGQAKASATQPQSAARAATPAAIGSSGVAIGERWRPSVNEAATSIAIAAGAFDSALQSSARSGSATASVQPLFANVADARAGSGHASEHSAAPTAASARADDMRSLDLSGANDSNSASQPGLKANLPADSTQKPIANAPVFIGSSLTRLASAIASAQGDETRVVFSSVVTRSSTASDSEAQPASSGRVNAADSSPAPDAAVRATSPVDSEGEPAVDEKMDPLSLQPGGAVPSPSSFARALASDSSPVVAVATSNEAAAAATAVQLVDGHAEASAMTSSQAKQVETSGLNSEAKPPQPAPSSPTPKRSNGNEAEVAEAMPLKATSQMQSLTEQQGSGSNKNGGLADDTASPIGTGTDGRTERDSANAPSSTEGELTASPLSSTTENAQPGTPFQPAPVSASGEEITGEAALNSGSKAIADVGAAQASAAPFLLVDSGMNGESFPEAKATASTVAESASEEATTGGQQTDAPVSSDSVAVRSDKTDAPSAASIEDRLPAQSRAQSMPAVDVAPQSAEPLKHSSAISDPNQVSKDAATPPAIANQSTDVVSSVTAPIVAEAVMQSLTLPAAGAQAANGSANQTAANSAAKTSTNATGIKSTIAASSTDSTSSNAAASGTGPVDGSSRASQSNGQATQDAQADPSQTAGTLTKDADNSAGHVQTLMPVAQAAPSASTTAHRTVDGSDLPSGIGEQQAGSGSIHSESGEPVATSSINTARLLQTMSESEMRVGMRSSEFGEISIRTSVSQQQMVTQISLDHSDLSQAIASHVATLQAKLGEDYGIHASIEVHNLGSSLANGSGQSSQREERDFARSARPEIGLLAVEESSPVHLAAAASVGSGNRLDIRA